MTNFAEDIKAYRDQFGDPEFIEVFLCDTNGILRGKWLPGSSVDKFEKGDVRLPISTYAPNIMGDEVERSGLGIVAGDPDGILVPIEGTLKPIPWLDQNVAQLQVEMATLDGKPTGISPRQILQNVVDGFNEKGLKPVVATELEFYICKKRSSMDEAPEPPAYSPQTQNYDLEVLSQTKPILDEILQSAEIQDLGTDTLIAEYGAGQFEVNFHHVDDALEAADKAVLFKRLVRSVVSKHGFEATFMAKPYADKPGNGMHVHASLLDQTGHNIFASEGDEPNKALRDCVSGLIASMEDLQAIFAPHFNSYRRFQVNSFAPSQPNWGIDNRGAAIRIPQLTGAGARLEHRIAGADTNPYLVLAGILGGMKYGLDHQPILPPSMEAPDYQEPKRLTADWLSATEQFAASKLAADIFTTEYRDLFVAIKLDEIEQLTSIISPMEYRSYLSRF